jgi:hypothetical protein
MGQPVSYLFMAYTSIVVRKAAQVISVMPWHNNLEQNKQNNLTIGDLEK